MQQAVVRVPPWLMVGKGCLVGVTELGGKRRGEMGVMWKGFSNSNHLTHQIMSDGIP